MLTIYTPGQPPVNLSNTHTRAIGICRQGTTGCPGTCLSGTGLALKTGWCREVATGYFRHVFEGALPGTLSIYGIRKHGTNILYQPSRCPGEIKRTTEHVDRLLANFFEMMVEMISCVLDDNNMPPSRAKDWLQWWGNVNFNNNWIDKGGSVGPPIRVILNSDSNDIPELQTQDPGRFWADGNMHGTITGIPVHWATSVPVMSYLLYLPRIWGAFYSTPRVLPKLAQISKRKRLSSPVLRSIIGDISSYKPNARHEPARLWMYLAGKLMLPFWCTSYGKEYFWTFTYLLIKATLDKTFNCKNEMPELGSKLRTLNRSYGEGFVSWLNKYRMEAEAPKWIRAMLSELDISGPSSLVHFSPVAAYI